jgi:DNA-directed RNA polymerase subunit L
MVLVKKLRVDSFSYADAYKRFKARRAPQKYWFEAFARQEAALFRCLELCKDELLVEMKTSMSETLPRGTQYRVEFELTEANVALANGLRRVLIDELDIWTLTFNEFSAIKESDMYIRCDFLKAQVQNLPIFQDLREKDIEDMEVFINVDNNLEDQVELLSGDIQVRSKSTGKALGPFWEVNVPLDTIQPMSKLIVKGIEIVKGKGKNDGGAFNSLANVSYDILDAKDDSLNTVPTHFFLGYSTHRNYKEALTPLKAACAYLIERFKTLLLDMPDDVASQKSDGSQFHMTNSIKIERVGEQTHFFILDDMWTLANIISEYAYQLDPDVIYLSSDIIHPDTDGSIVKITHPDALRVIRAAMEAAVKDIESIARQLA